MWCIPLLYYLSNWFLRWMINVCWDALRRWVLHGWLGFRCMWRLKASGDDLLGHCVLRRLVNQPLRWKVLRLLCSRCDEGFAGSDCQPLNTLASSVLSDFESQETLMSAWQEVTGGEIVPPDQGCGVVSSGSSLYFNKVWRQPWCRVTAGLFLLVLLLQSRYCDFC